ncbi:hypothetical protein C0992_011824 [Termitomyces sp. T32_za158]|nr:hypothetical protein C0992_011824 [Termitomyces sp. T32_za158]
MLTRLLNLEASVFRKIVLFTIFDSDFSAPLRDLASLSLVCRAAYLILTDNSAPLYFDIFSEIFDILRPLRRLGTAVVQEHAKDELKHRFTARTSFATSCVRRIPDTADTQKGPTIDDITYFYEHCQTHFADFPKIDIGVMPGHIQAPSTLSASPALIESPAYRLGTLTGKWQGSSIVCLGKGVTSTSSRLLMLLDQDTLSRIIRNLAHHVGCTTRIRCSREIPAVHDIAGALHL